MAARIRQLIVTLHRMCIRRYVNSSTATCFMFFVSCAALYVTFGNFPLLHYTLSRATYTNVVWIDEYHNSNMTGTTTKTIAAQRRTTITKTTTAISTTTTIITQAAVRSNRGGTYVTALTDQQARKSVQSESAGNMSRNNADVLSDATKRSLNYAKPTSFTSEGQPLTKLLLFAYMRGGSTIFSAMFNSKHIIKNSVFWYEPLDAFYSYYFGLLSYNFPISLHYDAQLKRRQPRNKERNALAAYIDSLLSCDADHLPFETLAHPEFIYRSAAFQEVLNCLPPNQTARDEVAHCNDRLAPFCVTSRGYNREEKGWEYMSAACHEIAQELRYHAKANLKYKKTRTFPHLRHMSITARRPLARIEYQNLFRHYVCYKRKLQTVRKCIQPMVKKACKPATLVSAKVVRAAMSDLEATIQRIPDLRIIHLVRDPRAIAVSRVQKDTHLMMTSDYSAVTEAQALCIRMQDDIDAKKTLELQYPGVILTVRYEDFVTEPSHIVEKVFDHLGRPPPENIEGFIDHWLHGNKNSGKFGIQRVDGSKSVDKWRQKVKQKEILAMNKFCESVLKEFNYKYWIPRTT